MSKPTHRIRAATGKYTDKEGNEKTQWREIGVAWARDEGGFSQKFEFIPLGWDGKCVVVPALEDDERQPQQRRSAPRQSASADRDEIPF